MSGSSTSLSLNSITYTGTINTITPTTFGYISGLTSSAQTQLTTLQTKTTNMTYTSGATNFGTNSLTADSLNTTLTQLANYSISSGGIGSPAGSLTLTSDTSNNYKSVIMTYPDGNTYFDNWQNGGIFHFREQIAGVSTKYLFDLNSANATFSVPLVATDVYSTSLATQNNIATANNVGIASTASIGSLHVLNNVNCDSINVNSNCQYNYKTIGYITCRNFVYETAPPISDMIPLTKSILSLAKLQTYCGIINLSDLLFNYSPDVYLYLYPSYNLVMLDSVNNVIWSSDNTLGTDILYIQINVLVSDLTQIIIYNNNLPIL